MSLENFLVYPIPTSIDWSSADPTIEEVWFESQDGTRLHGCFFPHSNSKHNILYCHGNGEDVSHNIDYVSFLRRKFQASVFLFDYRGYGKSQGRPHETAVIQDGLAAQRWLANRLKITNHDTVIWGRSLGGGVAVAISEQQGAKALVLQNTFHNMAEVAASKFPWLPVRWFMRNKFPSIDRINQYHGPVLQCHGTSDRVIPYQMGRQLFDAIPNPKKKFIDVLGGGHNDPTPKIFLNALIEFLDSLE